MGTLERRTISIIMSVIMVFSCFSGLTFSVEAETSGDYEYEVLDDGTVSITKYKGKESSVSLPADINGGAVTVIGINAFSYNKKIENIIIPNGVVRIEYGAFQKCTNLLNVDMPDSVIFVGKNAFSECTNLLNVKMSKKIINIGESAFYNCINLTEITIPTGVTKIEKSVFFGCENLEDVIIPDGVISIEDHAFCNCNSFKSVTIPNSVTSIKNGAFAFCINLVSVDMSDSIKLMEDEVFYGCSSLKEVSIPTNIDAIGDGIFYKCESLESITIPTNITKIGSSSFSQCKNIKNIIIPESITVIGDKAFNECSRLTEIEIPRSITNIQTSTFYRCSELEKVIIPDTVTTIGDFVFFECEKLKKVIIPNSVSSIGIYAFGFNKDKESIADFTIYGYAGTAAEQYATENGFKFVEVDSEYEYDLLDDGTVSITKYIGSDEEVTIPSEIDGKMVTKIGEFAFRKNNNLVSVEIPEGVTAIDYGAFRECENLTNVKFPNSISSIGEAAFRNCSSLTNVTIPEGVTVLGEESFKGCVGFTSVTIPRSVTEIGDESFGYFYNDGDKKIDGYIIYGYAGTAAEQYATENGFKFVEADSEYEYNFLDNETISITKYNGTDTDISIPSEICGNKVTEIGNYALSDCKTIKSLTVPDSVVKIGIGSFENCSNLEQITLSNNLTKIEIFAFDGYTKLKSINIPKGITSIGRYTFSNCSSLESIYFLGDIDIIASNAFIECNKLTIYCLKNSFPDLNPLYYRLKIDYGSSKEPDLTTKIPVKYITDTPAEKNIAVFSTERSLSINPGGSFNLGFGITDGTAVDFDSEWKQMSLSVGDPSVISVSDYVKTDCGYYVTVTGLKEGKSSVAVTDTDSGANIVIEIIVSDDYIKTYSYKIDEMREFYPDNNFENHLLTNIYDQNGLYVNNYKCEKKGGKYHVTFYVYNKTYYAGAVDIYDKNGLWQGYSEIEKNHDISSLKDTIDQTYYLITDAFNKKLITYEQAASSNSTSIDIYVPEGGYFTISNNMLTSPGTYLTNAFEIVFDGATTMLSLVMSDSAKNSALSDFKKEMGKNFTQKLIDTVNEQRSEAKKKAMQNVLLGSMQDKIKGIIKNYSNASLKDITAQNGKMFSDIAVWAENVFKAYNLDWKGIYADAAGITESLFTKFAGYPGLALDAYFSFSKNSQKLAMAYQLARSLNVPYSIVYSNLDDGYVTPDNVVVHTDGNIDSEAVLQVFKIGTDDTVNVILNSDDPLEAYELYNISFVKDDTLVQPNGKVKVYLPIPDGMVGNTCKVYRREPDGSWTVLDAHTEGSYLVFETDHFSVYALVGSRDEIVIISPAEKTEYEYGETLDTSGLVLSYAGEEIKRGYICSPSVLTESGEHEITVTFGYAQTKFTVTVDEKTENDESLTFADHDTDGIIDEAGGKVYIYPKNIGGITVGEFKLMFKNEIKVNSGDSNKVFNGMTFTFENRNYSIIIKGDTQADGKINVTDARTILRIAARLETPDEITKDAADIDSDGKVTSAEARSVLRFAAKLQNKIYE